MKSLNQVKFLGREHRVLDKGGYTAVFMEMQAYANSAVELYETQFGTVKPAETPFVSDSVLTPDLWEARGQLAESSASILMKLLWLARLSRPDINFPVVSLAAQISEWSRADDLRLKRLVGYVKQTAHFGIMGEVAKTEVPPLIRAFCDSDLAGCVTSCKSHSGIFTVIESGDRSFPISWTSKRQSAVARSTTEAETRFCKRRGVSRHDTHKVTIGTYPRIPC